MLMQPFRYVAYRANKTLLRGVVEAATKEEAWVEIARQGYKPLRVTRARLLPSIETLFPSFFKVGTPEMLRFTRQMAVLLESGSGILRALKMLQTQSRNRVMQRTLDAVSRAISEGSSFSAALAEHPAVFNRFFINVIEVGEHTGRLPHALEQMADMVEQEHEAKQKAVRTLMYPMAIVGLSLVTMGVLMTVALPPLLEIFGQMGADVPLITRAAVGMMGWVRDNMLHLFGGGVVLTVAFTTARRFPQTRAKVDRFMVRVPLVSSFIIAGELTRFSRSVFLLVDAGVPLATALHLCAGACKSQPIRRAFEEAEEDLLNGHGFAQALRRHPVLPPLFVELMTIGEEANSLERVLQETADTYQKQMDQRLNSLLAFLEPASTVVVGAIVGFIAFSMFVPIYGGLNAL